MAIALSLNATKRPVGTDRDKVSGKFLNFKGIMIIHVEAKFHSVYTYHIKWKYTM